MYKFFFNISLRNLTRRGIFPVINVAGLSIGLAVVLLICLLIHNERSFDKSFKESKNIYRINAQLKAYMPGETHCVVGGAVGQDIEAAVPEVLTTVRTYPTKPVIKIDDRMFVERVVWADKDFFRLFSTPFLQGSPDDALSQPNTIAISETMAGKLFGNMNPVGEVLTLNNRQQKEVKAIYKDFPGNSSFANYHIIGLLEPHQVEWGGMDYETFCLLAENADTASVGARMRQVAVDKGAGDFYMPALQRLDEIHLHAAKYQRTHTYAPSDIEKVKMLTLLAVIILLIACINYMNLSTARAQKRSKEIGVSKTFGARRSELIGRLSFETAIITSISFILAFVLAYVSLQFFNSILGEQLSFASAFNPSFLLGILSIWGVTTALAASYPAIYLSGFPPLMAIRQSGFTGRVNHATVRKILTVAQFSIAIVLIAWVVIIQTQIRYINNKDIGYNPHNLVGISLWSLPEGANFDALENDYRAQSSVMGTAKERNFLFNGSGNWLGRDSEDKQGIDLTTMCVDENFINLMQLRLIAGTSLPERRPGDTITQIVLNRKAVDYLDVTPEEIIGKKVFAEIGASASNPYVCGVVENFNFESLHRPIGGFGFHNGNYSKPSLMLRIKEGNITEQLKTYEQIFKNHFPNEMFQPVFVDDEIINAYKNERRTNRVAVVFSILAIIVACMGVFGLTAFMAEQRTREIGIRKVMGASVGNVVSLFTNSYVRLLLISLAIAIPIAWWVGNRYLQNFAYRISLSWWIFAVAAMITVLLTLLTVSVQALKAATANPVKAIKAE